MSEDELDDLEEEDEDMDPDMEHGKKNTYGSTSSIQQDEGLLDVEGDSSQVRGGVESVANGKFGSGNDTVGQKDSYLHKCPLCSFTTDKPTGVHQHAVNKHPEERRENPEMFGKRPQIPKRRGKSTKPAKVKESRVVKHPQIEAEWDTLEIDDAQEISKETQLKRLENELLKEKEMNMRLRNKISDSREQGAGESDVFRTMMEAQTRQNQTLLQLLFEGNSKGDSSQSELIFWRKYALDGMTAQQEFLREQVRVERQDRQALESRLSELEKQGTRERKIDERLMDLFEKRVLWELGMEMPGGRPLPKVLPPEENPVQLKGTESEILSLLEEQNPELVENENDDEGDPYEEMYVDE